MSDTRFKARLTQITIVPEHDPRMIHEQATKIDVDDAGAGEFLVISQESSRLVVEATEWPAIRAAIDEMIKGLVNDD